MRYLFLFGLILVSVLAIVDAANNQSHQKKSNQVNVHHNRNRSVKPASLATVHHRSKPVNKQRSVAKSHRNVAKKQTSNKKTKGVLVDRNGKRRRAVVKSKPRRKAVRAVRKITRRVKRVKPSSRTRSIRRRSSQRKRLAKQEEADIENSDQGFGEEQSVDSSGTSSDTSSSTTDESTAEQPASTPEETSDTSASQPAQSDTTNQSAASPQLPSNLPSNFNQITKSQAGKGSLGIGFASNSNGPAVAFGYATSVNGQNSAGGFGASFSTPDLLKAAQPDSTSTQQEGSTDELAQYRRPRRNNRRQDKYRG